MTKRLSLILAAALAAATLVAGTGRADDTKGPPCTNVVNGDAGYVHNADGSGTVQVILTLAAPACADASYLLDIYGFHGSPLLFQNVDQATISGNTVTFLYSFSPGPTDGVCVTAKTYYKKHLADLAPDSGCIDLEVESGGATGFH
jgi:hypothetical protein